MVKDIRKKSSERMQHTLEVLKKEFSSIRTGRASVAILDGIQVEYYGSPTPLSQVATLGTPDPRQILIQPWEPKLVSEIEKAILKSDLGITPMNDGKSIRLVIPPLTEERRKELVKVIRKKAEEAKVALRNIRRETNEALKKIEKEGTITEDELKKSLDDEQKLTDSYVKKVDEAVEHKEKEIMEV